jgi:brefeldin A-resistance guanine nucleotide exchange factor 1
MDKTLEPGLNGEKSIIAQKAAAAAAEVPMNALNVLALEGLLTIIESISRRVKAGYTNEPSLNHGQSFAGSGDSLDGDFADELTEEELQERKKQKAALSQVAKAFNKNPGGKGWIETGKKLGCLEETPESIAHALYRAPGIDKDELGKYLARGPVTKYPFEHKVRVEFVKQIDFTKHKTFAAALRVFLHKFRMPGEAQCIDRFMEAFSKELFRQQGAKSVFKNSDAVFVLAFSTIMLNTDLHNPQNKDRRMTREQFIRNNRGLNDGEDIPPEILTELYNQIRDVELQVQKEIGEFARHSQARDAEHFRAAWGDLLSKNVEDAAFTSSGEARKTMTQVGIHEKDMFLVIAKSAFKSISSAFIRSWDDGCVVDALKGLEQMARIATFFDLDKLLNDIMAFLLSQGREFIAGCVSLELAGIESGAPITQTPEDDETMSIVDPDSPVPQAVLRAREIVMVDPKRHDISGAAAYRGLLALNMGLRIVRTLFPRVRTAWPQLVEVLASLRDARALPPGLADLDDFADSDGNVLPLSPFAEASQKKLDDYYKSLTGKQDGDKKGWFRLSFFRGKKAEGGNELEPEPVPGKETEKPRGQLSANTKTLLQVAQRVEVEKLIVYPPNMKLPLVKHCIKNLLDSVDKFPTTDSPTYEQHTAFALELAIRALLADRERAVELLPYFLPIFQSVAAKVSKDEYKGVAVPFLVERVIVSILRTSIHLYANPKVRHNRNTAFCITCKFNSG